MQISVIMVCFVFYLDNRKERVLSLLLYRYLTLLLYCHCHRRSSYQEGRLEYLDWFNPTTYLYLSQTRTWISNIVLCAQCVNMKDWYWWICWLSLFKLSFHKYLVVIFVCSGTPICLSRCFNFISTYFIAIV